MSTGNNQSNAMKCLECAAESGHKAWCSLAPATCSTDVWQQGVASMAENARADVAWSRECLKRGDDPNIILDRMDEWLKKIIEQINPPNESSSAMGASETKKGK